MLGMTGDDDEQPAKRRAGINVLAIETERTKWLRSCRLTKKYYGNRDEDHKEMMIAKERYKTWDSLSDADPLPRSICEQEKTHG